MSKKKSKKRNKWKDPFWARKTYDRMKPNLAFDLGMKKVLK